MLKIRLKTGESTTTLSGHTVASAAGHPKSSRHQFFPREEKTDAKSSHCDWYKIGVNVTVANLNLLTGSIPGGRSGPSSLNYTRAVDFHWWLHGIRLVA